MDLLNSIPELDGVSLIGLDDSTILLTPIWHLAEHIQLKINEKSLYLTFPLILPATQCSTNFDGLLL